MERIKLAVEKAKAQQPENIAAQAISSAKGNLESIEYRDTRVIKLNPETLRRNKIIAMDKNDVASMSFDFLRTSVLQKMEEKGWKNIAITSPIPGSGKTTIAVNLAIGIAQQTNKTSMLIDFDLRKPRVGYFLGLQMEKSLNDFLNDTAEIQDILVNPDIPRFVVIPTNNSVEKPSETLSSKKISSLVNELSQRYESRIVIFDLPPTIIADDVMTMTQQVDCFLIVVPCGLCSKQIVEDCLRLIPPEKVLGVILNKATSGHNNAYYYDHYKNDAGKSAATKAG